MSNTRLVLASLVAAAALSGCGKPSAPPEQAVAPSRKPAAVDAARIEAADSEPGNWMSYGRTYERAALQSAEADQRATCRPAGLAWYFDLDTDRRGQE